MLVLHERKSRVTLAARLTGKTAAETISAMLAVFGRIDPHLRRSITFDNDTAFAQHRLLRTMCDMTTWLRAAYRSGCDQALIWVMPTAGGGVGVGVGVGVAPVWWTPLKLIFEVSRAVSERIESWEGFPNRL